MKKLLLNVKEDIVISLEDISAIKLISIIISVLLIAFFILSFIDVISNNMGSASYHPWNFFTIMMKLSGK